MKRAGRVIVFMLSLAVFLAAGRNLYGIYLEYAAGDKVYEAVEERFVQPVASVQSGGGEQNGGNGQSGSGTGSRVGGLADDPKNHLAGSQGIDEGSMNGQSSHAEEKIVPSMNPDEVPVTIDFASLKAVCPDVIGWLYCVGTPINYPVVQSDDNDYYLYRLPDGTENKNGTIFLDFRNDPEFGDWNHLIFGHNMKNGAMFGSLTDYMEQEYYEQYPFWFLLTEEQNYRIDLVGGYVTPDGSEAYALPTDTAGRDALFRKVSRSSVFDVDVELMEEDRLVTMSTCVYDYEDARFVLVGVLREVGDDSLLREVGDGSLLHEVGDGSLLDE